MKDEYARLSKGYILQAGNVLEITINELSTMEKNPATPENYIIDQDGNIYHPVSYTHLRAHETVLDLVCRLLLEKKKILNHYIPYIFFKY